MTALMPFQAEDQKTLHSWNGRCLLASQMGTGKTLIALKYIQECNKRPAIIVCPAAVKLHWQREAMQHCGLKSTVLHGTSTRYLEGEDIIILNYDILRNWLPRLRRLQPQIIIGDEIHYVSSAKAKRTRAFQTLCSGVEHVLGLSGTPLTNRPIEMFTILNILADRK